MSEIRKSKSYKNAPQVQMLVSLIDGKWSMPVIYALQQEILRYSNLEKALPDITQRALTNALRNLERNGMIERRAHPTILPQVEYELTSLGLELLKLCEIMSD